MSSSVHLFGFKDYESMKFDVSSDDTWELPDCSGSPILTLERGSPFEPPSFAESVERTKAAAVTVLASVPVIMSDKGSNGAKTISKKRVRSLSEIGKESARSLKSIERKGDTKIEWTPDKIDLLKAAIQIYELPSLPSYITGEGPYEWRQMADYISLRGECSVTSKSARDRWLNKESDKIDPRQKPIGDREVAYLENNIELLQIEKNIWAAISKMLYKFNGRDKYIPANTVKNTFNSATSISNPDELERRIRNIVKKLPWLHLRKKN